MSSLRAVSSLRVTAQRTPVMFKRYYAPDSRAEGTTGSSKGFSKREEAEEGAYIKRKEHERLKQAREKLEAAQKEVADAEKSVNEKK